jgi:hypothetical protein
MALRGSRVRIPSAPPLGSIKTCLLIVFMAKWHSEPVSYSFMISIPYDFRDEGTEYNSVFTYCVQMDNF